VCGNTASTVLRGGRNTIYRKVERFSSTRLRRSKVGYSTNGANS
jgi:hypothetical protein